MGKTRCFLDLNVLFSGSETVFTITESLYQLTYLASLTYLTLSAAKAPAQNKPSIQAKDTNIQPKLPLAPLKKRQLNKFEYDLQYRRLNHLGPVVIIRANKVANLVKLIPLARILGKVCDVYAKAKITDGRNLQVSKRKPGILYLISFNVYGPLPLLRLGFEYFLLLIDNYLRFNQVRLIKIRNNCYVTLASQKKIVKRRTEAKFKAVRLDNAPELIKQVEK